ncbi:type II secretion system protein N [Pseudaquabacterium pictum]|uniref:Type II secretion system protein N n=1 Tax=Pseudaquabacterium pictum TaxID=2315236 RepID=A0A480AVK3_9BURK|nr:type II secretion system protein N [Rubrivivax pictus]GCL65739.1 general secretion pathway protein GspN [Rubrivivax pictus]
MTRAPRGTPADTSRWQRALRAGRRWAVWGAVLGLGAGLVTQAPAQWLADGLQNATGGRLLLAEARGSLWNGSAVLVLTGGAGSRDAAALPGRLQWQLRPGWNGLQLTAQQACCLPDGLRLQLQPGWGGFSLALDGPAPPPGAASPAALPAAPRPLGQWPASWLAGLGTPWNTLQLGGQLQLSSAGLRLQSAAGQLRLQGDLLLQLRGASSRLSVLPTLGSYQLLLQGSGQADSPTQLRLTSQDGPLRLNGEGQWTGARLRFRGTAQATDGQDDALANLLNIIGRRQGALSVISIG